MVTELDGDLRAEKIVVSVLSLALIVYVLCTCFRFLGAAAAPSDVGSKSSERSYVSSDLSTGVRNRLSDSWDDDDKCSDVDSGRHEHVD
jgi:hypothetical protein